MDASIQTTSTDQSLPTGDKYLLSKFLFFSERFAAMALLLQIFEQECFG